MNLQEYRRGMAGPCRHFMRIRLFTHPEQQTHEKITPQDACELLRELLRISLKQPEPSAVGHYPAHGGLVPDRAASCGLGSSHNPPLDFGTKRYHTAPQWWYP